MPSKYQRKSRIREPLKRIIIAMEGNRVEPKYFNELKKLYQATSLNIVLLTRNKKDTNSAPKYVIEQIRAYKRKTKVEKIDEFWIIIDKDRWSNKQLSEIAEECISSRYNLGLSNPCFEIWLILHFENLLEEMGSTWSTQTAHDKWNTVCKEHNISSYVQIVNKVDAAIKMAGKIDADKTSRWANSLGTRVYKLAESILNNR